MPGAIKTAAGGSTTRASAATFTTLTAGLRPERDSTVFVHVNVTAATGTAPTLTCSVEWSHDGTTFIPADPVDTMTAIAGVGGGVKGFTLKAPFFRVKEVVGGTSPNVTRDINFTYA